MSDSTKALLKSWGGTFVAALITGFLSVFAVTGEIPTDSKVWLAVLGAGLVAVLPVIRNYFDTAYKNYGKGALSAASMDQSPGTV